MQITIHLPKDVEQRLRESSPDLERDAQEALALELFRKQRITHFELGQMLGLDRFETDAFLVDRAEFSQSPTTDELEGDLQKLIKLPAEKL